MADEINFMDLVILLKINPNTTLEKLGSIMNSSIFDAGNAAGSMKQKELIDFTANYPGPNAINITEQGKALISEADAISSKPFDALDSHILRQLSGGSRAPAELQTTLNVRPKDLALRLYKESKQGFMTYDVKNGAVELMLTEKGFLQAKSWGVGVPSQAAASGPATAVGAAPKDQVQQVVQQQQPDAAPYTPPRPDTATPMPERSNKKKFVIIAVLVVILAAVYAIGHFMLHTV
jgi:hypothetical protein